VKRKKILPLIFVLFLLFLPSTVGGQTHGSLRLRLDEEGTLTTRAIILLGPSRWFLLGRSTVVLSEESPAPAGYTSNRVRPRSPFEEGQYALGVEAGPLILGPIQGQGIYQRLQDPTRGGARWSGISDRSRFVPLLDPEVQDRQGVAVALGTPAGPAGFSVWYLERDERYRLEGMDWWLSPIPDAWIGRFGVLLARVHPDEDIFRDPSGEPWLFDIPPRAPRERRIQSLYWELRPGGTALHVLLESWRQRSGLGPPLHAGNVALALGPPALRASLRVATAERGFLTLEEGRPRHSRLAAGELSHRSVYTPLILEGALRSSWWQGWEKEQPGPARREIELALAALRMRILPLSWLERVSLKGRVRTQEERDDSDPQVRLESGTTLALPVALILPALRHQGSLRMNSAFAWEREGYRHATASLLLLIPAGWGGASRRLVSGRTVSAELSGRFQWDRQEGPGGWYLAAAAGVPLGERWRLSLRVRTDEEWSGTITLEYGW
jgi:hypothetical protein